MPAVATADPRREWYARDVRVLWTIVLLAAIAALGASFVSVGDDGIAIEGIGVMFVLPLGVIGWIAIAGMRERWSRGLAFVGFFAAVMSVAIAVLLYAAVAVGRGVGDLLGAIARTSAVDQPVSAIGITAIAACVAGLGCLFALAVGPPRPLVLPADDIPDAPST